MTAAELVEVKDGQIVRGELIYDAEELRRAMAAATRRPRRSEGGGSRHGRAADGAS
jgi:hypothetical protein